MLEQRAYDTVKQYDSIVASAGAVASIADNGSGKVRITTTGVHGIATAQVVDGHIITLTGSVVDSAAYNTAHTVTAIISTTVFDTDFDFNSSEGAVAAFLVEKIYLMSPGLKTAIVCAKGGNNADVFIAIQAIDRADKHNADIIWSSISEFGDDLFEGDSNMVTGVKLSGNPAGEVKIAISQMESWA